MSNHKNLVFFNNQGDSLNYEYKDSVDRFEGDILFDENSSDTFKTAGIYMFEKIASFEYELPGLLTLDKFQLFNEFGLHFYGAKYASQSVDRVEPVNNDPNFYSKWVYGTNFESRFPIGTIIVFNSPLMEFNNPNQTYVVVSTKKNALMIISTIDNATFDTTYYTTYNDPNTYIGKTITGINVVSVYNYIDELFNNNLSNWSEPNFYDKYYVGKKLNIVNSINNDGAFTVTNVDITDIINFEYEVSGAPTNSNLIMEVITRTDLPIIYEGPIDISSNKVSFSGVAPSILKPGSEFKIVGSSLNTNFLNVSALPTFLGNTQLTYYSTQSQVLWNNRVYECLSAYTQSATSSINPDNTSYWTLSTYVPVDESTVSETLLNVQVYLTTDHFYFEYGWTQSNAVTLASTAEKYAEDLKIFNIDLYYKYNKLKADLIYPSNYAEVNFYYDNILATSSIGSMRSVYEKAVQVREDLITELSYDYSTNKRYNIVFTDIDEFGIKIIINKMVYQEEISWVYSTGITVDMDRTIDATLRNWMERHYVKLITLGIIAELEYIGNFSSIYYNSIILNTQYPNVPMDFSVEVGTTADFHIEHSTVLFTDMGGYLSFIINDKSYDQATVFLTGTMSQYPDIPATLSAWVEAHTEYLTELGITVVEYNNLLSFSIEDLERRFTYEIKIGKSLLPGLSAYTINNKIKGNEGVLIASNEVLLPSGAASLEEAGFATGMVFSINNTVYPFDNQEYNIQYLDPDRLNLSYQGPFWGLTDSLCNSSAFVTIAFNTGFGQTGCSPSSPITGFAGPFEDGPFNTSEFSISYNPNTYTVNEYALSSHAGTSNLIDIQYVQLSNSIYGLGDDVTVIDAYTGYYNTTISLLGNTQSVDMEYNPINSYLYCLSSYKLFVVDPLLNVVVDTITLTYSGYDLAINTVNGDVYVSYDNISRLDIWDYSNTQQIPLTGWGGTFSGKMAFNVFQEDMYLTTKDTSDIVYRIDGATRAVQYVFGVPGISNLENHTILYEQVNESVYVYGSASLYKIDGASVSSISSVSSQTFSELLFNNISGEMNISDTSNNFTQLDLNTNVITQTGVSRYGYLSLNQYDGDVYLSSLNTNTIIVVDSTTGAINYTAPMSANTTKSTYNPERKSVWALQPSTNAMIEVMVVVNAVITIVPSTHSSIGENLYGTLSDEYVPKDYLWLKSREYIRKPRENYEGEHQTKFYWKWFSDNVPQFFLYDFSGDQLETSGSYSYTGVKPLDKIVLSKYPNKDYTKASLSEWQQTIFDVIEYPLEYINDSTDISTESEPMQVFVGFNSPDEGALRSILQLFKKEEIEFDIVSNSTTDNIITFETLFDSNTGANYGQISLSALSENNFIDDDSDETFVGVKRGLKVGQTLALYITDNTNIKKQYISPNNGRLVKIREIYTRVLIVDFINKDLDKLDTESTKISDYPKAGQTTYLTTKFKVWDREIGRFTTYGQTEVEDIRYKIELSNVGKNIGSNETFIFKDYDINEGGIDWTFLNKKRKEMLMMKHLIYPYIGSYKSIINAINYFGYNDLELNEYYRNIDETSENYLKLFKVEIPDIFDNTVEGWTDNDFLKHTLPNEKYQETSLFNLTYNITDKEGNIILNYTLDEVIIKLQGLKYWLKKNIIPLTHKILDITGRAHFVGGSQIQHRVQDINIINVRQSMTPITFKMNEAYLMPVNSGSTVYNCVLDFSTQTASILPDYFNIDIKTYKTYKEWAPFTTYNIGDLVTYYGRMYESHIDNNKVKNPRKYENLTSWDANTVYIPTNIISYEREFYVYSGIGTYSAIVPPLDTTNWLNITEWKEIDFEPVQRIQEFRNINSLLPFNFTIDSNIDPFIAIEVSSDNGYGLTYRDKKNYEVRGLLDLRDPVRYIDPIGPFVPISNI